MSRPERPEGIGLREWLAGMAIHAMLNNPNTTGTVAANEIAKGAVLIADAAIGELRSPAHVAQAVGGNER
jgi:hypothetical protein